MTMLKKSPHIKSIIRQHTALNEIANQASFLAKIDKLVRRHLTTSLRDHCKVANYRENILYLHVDSPAWSTRLRFTLPLLASQLRQFKELRNLQDIQIHHAPKEPTTKSRVKPKKLRLSKDTAEQLICLADHVTDKNFAQALIRLAKHSR